MSTFIYIVSAYNRLHEKLWRRSVWKAYGPDASSDLGLDCGVSMSVRGKDQSVACQSNQRQYKELWLPAKGNSFRKEGQAWLCAEQHGHKEGAQIDPSRVLGMAGDVEQMPKPQSNQLHIL